MSVSEPSCSHNAFLSYRQVWWTYDKTLLGQEGNRLMKCLVSRRRQSEGNSFKAKHWATQASRLDSSENESGTGNRKLAPGSIETCASIRTPAAKRSVISEGLRGVAETQVYVVMVVWKLEVKHWAASQLLELQDVMCPTSGLSLLLSGPTFPLSLM